jgi:O-acetyl-ADP-ribose deacetylase (regulator of RNase III)
LIDPTAIPAYRRFKCISRNEEITMHRYETSTPRVALGITAVAMTAITIGVLVVMPARMRAISHEHTENYVNE